MASSFDSSLSARVSLGLAVIFEIISLRGTLVDSHVPLAEIKALGFVLGEVVFPERLERG